MILISSEIEHSLSKVLPLQQSLIPVCFKRKLSYTGSYIEEYVEKEKIKLYFAWFKKHNHLFKDIDLDSSLIDSFEDESTSSAEQFENTTRDEEDVSHEDNANDQTGLEVHEVYFQNDKDAENDRQESMQKGLDS